MLVWLGETIRPTKDLDLLGFGELSATDLESIFAEICARSVPPDGLVFDPGSIRVSAIRPENPYGGQRLKLSARLGKTRLRVQVDVGVGDAVTPSPVWMDFPSLLDLPRPRLRAYRPETAIAEKVHAMVILGSKNSRMRDFFDVHALATHESFDGSILAEALSATFSRRATEIPEELPLALTPAFAQRADKQRLWVSFTKRIRLTSAPRDLTKVIHELASFLGPPLTAAALRIPFTGIWNPGGPWKTGPAGD